MSTQSKSVLVPFLIIAGLLFVVALAWKLLANNDTDTVTKTAEVEMTNQVKTENTTVQPTVQNIEPEVIDYDQPEPFIDYTQEDKEVMREEARSSMRYAMRYSTFDKAIAGLDSFRANGNNQSAEELISYIYRAYPNETIPAELLD